MSLRHVLNWLMAWPLVGLVVGAAAPTESDATAFGPTALVQDRAGNSLYLAGAASRTVAWFDLEQRRRSGSLAMPAPPLGLALSPTGDRLYVTCAAPESRLVVIDTATRTVVGHVDLGHTAMAPVVSPEGRLVFVAERFADAIAIVDIQERRVRQRVPVPREPCSLALTPDGKSLFVAHHLQAGRADAEVVAATVSVIDVPAGRVAREIALPNGSTLLRDVRISPDGRHAVVAHQVSRFHLPTTQLERGWVNTSALSLIDVAQQQRINTVLLDNLDAGAANPWGIAWSADGRQLVVTHAGTHEISVLDFPALLAKLEKIAQPDLAREANTLAASRTPDEVPNDLSFLVGLRRRIHLAPGDRGPRTVVFRGSGVWVGNYFSDTLTWIDLGDSVHAPTPSSSALGAGSTSSLARQGEAYFNDASLCFQGWQSCASCHSDDARVDSLNWDNLNDGIGNPKSSKSLLLGHRTPPAMWLGVRASAYVSVRTGIRHSLFTVQPPEVATAIDAFMESLQPMPSPQLRHGQLSPAAKRGQALFQSEAVGCADCHHGELYTDLKFHDVGTVGKYDQPTNRFDTPTLIEVWRTAPYLHDGRAASMREVLTTFNAADHHGVTSTLSPSQIDDLVEFVLSL